MAEESQLYDVVAVNLAGMTVRVLTRGVSLSRAEAQVMFAIMRRGVEEEFFAEVPAGKFKDGDSWLKTTPTA